MQKLYNVDTYPDTHYHVSQFFGQEFNYTSEHEDAIPLIWLQNSVVDMQQELKCKDSIWILIGNFWKKCAEDVRDARTTWQCILEKKAVTVTGDYNWFSIEDSSLLECDVVLLDESSPWRWRQYDPSTGQKLLVQSQSIISYRIFSKTALRTSNLTWFFTVCGCIGHAKTYGFYQRLLLTHALHL